MRIQSTVSFRLNQPTIERPGSPGIGLISLFAMTTLLLVVGMWAGPLAAQETDYSPGLLSEAHSGFDDPDSCENCHNDDYEVEGDRCLICHDQIQARMEAGKGVHREVSVDDCAVCHAEHGGRDAEMLPLDRDDFDHATETGFALEGFHGDFRGDCSRCHTTRSFLDLNTGCASCHGDAHAGTLGGECTECHAVDTHFKNASRAFHKSTVLPLEGRHLDVPCADCHTNAVIIGTPNQCYDCHWIRRQDTPHRLEFGADCENCHTPFAWTATSWDHAAATGFDIGGNHQKVGCEGCHPGWRFDGSVSPDCYSCHAEDYNGTRDPDHRQAGFPTDCILCHSPNDGTWNRGTFDHPYELVGVHRTQPCDSCHAGGIYEGTPTDCVGCHADDYNESQNPNHPAAGFPTTCDLCHRASDSSWRDATFSHDGYQLVGVHATLDCASCHPDGIYEGTPRDCVGCHQADYDQSVNPNHQAAGFPTTCESCHSASDGSWHDANYPHNAWPLVGSHTSQQCISCHTGDVYQGLPSECVDCHLDDYNSTDNPDHGDTGFPTTCEICHTPTSWDDGQFDHPFQLEGVHATLDCLACHSNGYPGTPTDCVGCHQADYDGTANPNHGAAGFPTACDSCHAFSDPDWHQANYPHTVWPLVGAHTSQQCTSCHTGDVYQGLPSECVDCHLDDYNNTSDPDHGDTGFPTTCEVCHTPTSWDDGNFDHPFQLEGVHATLDCLACHSNGYPGTPTDCVGCHQADYDGTANPNHGAAGFPTACDSCHAFSDPDWHQANYPHTVWPLVGAHTSQQCISCHTGDVYQGLPSECVDCHLDDYNSTSDPDHGDTGFPTTCEVCHTPTSWDDGNFDHPFQLEGVHATLDCLACHSNGYPGTPTDCVGCHQADYDGTANPNHGAAGFPTACDSCHAFSDPDWHQANYPHTVWPLVGAHTSQQCTSCHTGDVYQGLPSECVDCHLDDYNNTSDPDHGDTGFPTTCEVCHTPTSWDDGQFNHPYPLVGVHATLDCLACHADGYPGTPTDCVGCHLDDYNGTDDPDHAAAGFPTDCEICHNPADNSWDDGDFNHIWFPIDSGAHVVAECSDCHRTPGTFLEFSCNSGGCHPRGPTGEDHDEVDGYDWDSDRCYFCHPNGQPPPMRPRNRMRPSHEVR